LFYLGVTPGKRQTLTFDDLTGSNWGFMPRIYKCFIWENFYYMHTADLHADPSHISGFNEAFVGGNKYVAFIADVKKSSAISRQNGQSFDFHSFQVSAARYDSLTLVITGLYSGTVRFGKTQTLAFSSVKTIYLNWNNIDKILFEVVDGVQVSGLDQRNACFISITIS